MVQEQKNCYTGTSKKGCSENLKEILRNASVNLFCKTFVDNRCQLFSIVLVGCY